MGGIFMQIVILMILAVLSVAFFRRIHLPPILAYLFAGLIAGPELISLFPHPEDMHLLAEIGIVFLLFSLGLEFSLPKLLAMRNLVFGVGLVQMLMTMLVFSLVLLFFDFSIPIALIIGGMFALSSTAIVIKQVTELGILNNRRTQLAISILLFQDLAVVPFLIAIPIMASSEHVSFVSVLLQALLKGVFVVALLLSIGKWVLPWIFREVARSRTDELFVLTTILIALLAAGLTYAFGLSMALGAFLAGMMLGESQYKYQLEADIRPFRDILMGLFFVTVGMQLDLSALATHGVWIIPGVLALMLVKVLLVRLATRLFHCNPIDSWAAGFKLCQIGEFSFVIASLAATQGVISSQLASILISMGVVSMAITPWLISHSKSLAERLVGIPEYIDSNDQEKFSSEGLANHVVIAGFGRVGQSVARLLKMEAIPFVAVDIDPVRVHESLNAGEPIMFGDACQKDILTGAGLAQAKLMLITFDFPDKAVLLIDAAKKINPEIEVMVRIKRDYQLDSLYQAGASHVVPEMQEGSLMLISQVLHYAGVPMSRILKRVRAERKGRYDHLHGFYPGETTEISYGTEDKLEFIHAIVLNKHASCLGKSIEELNLSRLRINVRGLRRAGKEATNPDKSEILQQGDVLIIAGKPRRVERAERFLLEGG
ncbi:monovalent cation:proton antiporter family protein [Alteromonas ponticola]|uniref:Potassium transporter n=1 Tax=Alteromonas ponticola TaxID=2720613 RepID=A0ABX1R1B0_9ALTE|nr:monovalent cation:proton antiporter family protein [Alteromonas ponticola]NMH59696.1 potassium transporter [Alteromonas ponticola]